VQLFGVVITVIVPVKLISSYVTLTVIFDGFLSTLNDVEALHGEYLESPG